MQVDIEFWVNALRAAIGVIPPALIVIVLLGGPTGVWLFYRFVVQPRSTRLAQVKAVDSSAMWVCPTCRSINDLARNRCYRCFATPSEDELEVIDAHPAGPYHLTPVGPGLDLGSRAASRGAPIARIERAAAVWIEDDAWERLEARRDRAALPDVAAMTELVEAPYGSPRPPIPIAMASARRRGSRPEVMRPRRVIAAGPQDPDDTPAA